MAWSKNVPGANDRLKDSQSDIQQNFEAIETGGVPYDAIKLQNQESAPGTESGHGFLYTKTDDNELYFKDSGGTEAPVNQIRARGSFDTTGAAIGTPVNISFTKGTGDPKPVNVYTATIAPELATTNYQVSVTIHGATNLTQTMLLDPSSKTTSAFDLRAINRSGTNDSATALGFDVIVIGGY